MAAVSLFLKILKLKGITHALIRVNPKNTNSLRIPIKCNFRETGEITTNIIGETLIGQIQFAKVNNYEK